MKTLVIQGETGYDLQLTISNKSVLNIKDVDCSRDSVERLAVRLCGEEIDAEQLPYLVHDHLVREYTVLK